MSELNFKQIESKWQKEWEKTQIFKTKIDSKKEKYFCLEFFPYPSSFALHMGHVRNYTIGDIIARFKRMQGFNVLYPMGYDSFGLPAENAAKKEGIHPKEYTERAIKQIIQYQKDLGNSYDWSRKISTHEPEYYKWNQYFFLKFLEKGLVYRKKSPVNWCPDCKSTLANEEVVNGKCWRHENTEVIQKELEQWFLKTTAYADELLKDIEKLEWSDKIKTLQRNWIGKSEGLLVDFSIKGSKEKLQIFTTRPDTIFGVTFMVVSPKHKLINELAKTNKKELGQLNKKVSEEKEKEGVFLGSYAVNPLTKEEIPVYAANVVVAEYGTGAVMAVPAHDQRDYEFAKKYNLQIKQVILGGDIKKEAYVGEGSLENSDQFDGMDSKCAIVEISKYIVNEKLGKKITQYKLRDWLISRQRYWGTPIPIIYCDKCGIVPLKEKDLPLKLPEKIDYKLEGNPLNHVKEWVNVKCPNCKSNAKRETDTMGGFVDSSWYFLRFCSPNNNKEAFDKKEVDYWMPVDQYIGGIEHAVGHLIYSRFFTKVLRDMKLLKFDEPFQKLFNQGIVYKDNHKMSKSFGNVVYQTDISNKYGIDTARVFLMSVSNPESDMEWSDKGAEGSFRFLEKIQRISELSLKQIDDKGEHKKNLAIKNFTNYIEEFKFNLAIIELMKYTDYLIDNPAKEGYRDLLKMISLFAPHIAEELWSRLNEKSFISIESWPKLNEKKINPEIEEQEEQVEKLISDILNIVNIVKEKGKKVSKAFVYILPKELENYAGSLNEIQKRTNLQIKIFAVNDKNKHDPENKAQKAKPGKPAIYLE